MKLSLGERLSAGLTTNLMGLKNEFFSTFQYTATGNNYTHPVTLGAITRVIATFPNVVHIGIDVRLNDGNGTKFQPDIVGFDKEINAVLIIDYESPNSSDARVPLKDWVPYANWAKGQKEAPPYFIVTTLPDKESPEWELRYTSENKYNVAFRGRRDEIRKNPFRFWYAHYQSERKSFDLSGIEMLNINCGAANVVQLDRI